MAIRPSEKTNSLTIVIVAPTEERLVSMLSQWSSKGQLASMRRPRSPWALVVASEGMGGTPDEALASTLWTRDGLAPDQLA